MSSLVRRTGSACVILASAALLSFVELPERDGGARARGVRPNDNREPAGRLSAGVLTVRLTAEVGTWYPEKEHGPAHEVYVFGEEGGELWNPGPLLRVPAGTEVRASIRNALGGEPLIVHGLHDRPGAADTVHVPVGGIREVRFRLTEPGTYVYWATTRGARAVRERWGKESQLHGAIVVDPPGPVAPDRVFVIGIEDDSAALPQLRPMRAAVINGLSWPHTERMTVPVGDTVRMRWINPSDRRHPIHLHGFYFRVDSRGDGVRDTVYTPEQRRLAVTELMEFGGTFTLTWVPDRAGNWLVHCHMAEHMSPELRGGRPHHPEKHVAGARRDHNHALEAMSGLVTGWTVVPSSGGGAPAPEDGAGAAAATPRKLRLLVQRAPGRFGADPGLGFVIQSGDAAPRGDSVVIPGPPLVLRRGEPVVIDVVNRLDEPTSIHWHGIELDSYFDGVSGWSGAGRRIAPHIEPGDSFQVRFTPPRAGTFIYHSHFEERRQLASGVYGPMIVLEPGAAYDPETDLSWILAQHGPAEPPPPPRVALNGSTHPVIDLAVGRRYRIRLININPTLPLTVQLLSDSVPVTWRAVAKDGAELPASQARTRPAVQMIGVGEAYDFELTREHAGDLTVRALDPGGVVRVAGVVRVRGRVERE